MIATAKAISHGHAHIEYIKGESPNKKHKDKIFHVCENMLPKYASGAAIWEEVCELTADRPRMKNNLIRIIVSPSEDYTKDFTIADWQQLWLDFAREFDGIELRDEKTGEIYSPKTNILGSLYTVELHLESESGVPHLHAAVCRVDKDGRTNNDHDIHLRAQRAAETVAMRRGWKTAAEVSEENTAQIRSDCLDILGGMQQWSLPSFFRRLADRGYDVKVTRDKDGVARGYTVRKGRNCYRASRIDRRLTVSRLEQTWRALHRQAKPASQKPPSPAAQKKNCRAAADAAQASIIHGPSRGASQRRVQPLHRAPAGVCAALLRRKGRGADGVRSRRGDGGHQPGV